VVDFGPERLERGIDGQSIGHIGCHGSMAPDVRAVFNCRSVVRP
jgi:hypothetical protein